MTMRKTRSFLSLFLVVVLVLSLGTNAVAAEVTPSADPVCTEENCTHDHAELHEEDTHVCTEECSHDEESTVTDTDETTISTDEATSDIESNELQTDEAAPEEVHDDSVFDWSISDGVLVIDGHGTPEVFTSAEDQPWAAVREQITEAYIDDCCGLNPENIAYWFAGCTNLSYAELPTSVQTIGYHAFFNCKALANLILFHESAPTIQAGAFVTNKPVPAETPHDDYRLHIDVMNAGVMDSLCRYDWYADGSPVTISPPTPNVQLMTTAADAPMMRAAAATRASGTCELCRVTCSYTVGYDQWTATYHCVRHWCSNCGLDQYGGVVSENHTYSSNGYCSKCGYYNSAYDNSSSVCYHSSTRTSWSGCDWYKYCRSCGELVDSGTSHGTYVYGSWTYYSTTQHRRTYTCSDCGQGSYSYGSHSTSTKYAQDSSSQHTVGSYCATCGSYVGSLTYKSHNFTYGAWSNYSSSQHRRTAACSDCGYSTYEYASHSLSYGDWEINEGSDYSNTHKRTVSCSCGYSTTEYEAHNCYGVSEWEYSDSTYHKRHEECECGYTRVHYTSHTYTTSYESCSDEAHNVIMTCSTCGHSSTSTEAHSFSYGSWTSSSDTHHQRSASCICGYDGVEYGNHVDADDDGYCDDCTYLMTRFSVTVPASLSLTVSKNGEVYAATSAQIVNNSTGAVCVTSVKLSAENDWQLVPYSTNMADVKVDSKQIGFSLNGAESDGSATLPISSWVIAKNSVLSLDYDAVVSATSNPINEQVLTVVFVLNWAVV